MATNYVTLGEIAKTSIEGITLAETTLRTGLSAAQQGTSIGIGQLFELQYTMSAYTISANTFSSVLKEA